MKKTLKVHQILKANMSLSEIIAQDSLFSIKVAYSLSKVKHELETAENYVLSRFTSICGDIDFENMTENQKIIYKTISESDIDIEIPIISINEITENNDAKISVRDMENIECLFS